MTHPKKNESEEKALDALGMLALLTRHRKELTEKEAAGLMEDVSLAELTQDEIEGTGEFAFDAVWARIQEGDSCVRPAELEPKHAEEAFAAMHRGKSKIAPEALEELERRRREALGDDNEDDGPDGRGEDAGD